jgi:hypothetical protein
MDIVVSYDSATPCCDAFRYRDYIQELLSEFNDGNHTCALNNTYAVYDVFSYLEIPCTLDVDSGIVTTNDHGIEIALTQVYDNELQISMTEPISGDTIFESIVFVIEEDTDDYYHDGSFYEPNED